MVAGARVCVPTGALNDGGVVGRTTSRGEFDTYSVTGMVRGLLTAGAPLDATFAVIVIVPVHVPSPRPAGLSETPRDVSVDPVIGTPVLLFSTSQLEPVQVVCTGVAVKFRVAPVLLPIFNSCCAGAAFPIWNGKESEFMLVTMI